MDVHSELRFDADPARVFAMLTDETYVERKTLAANALRATASVKRDGENTTIHLTRVMPPDVPDFVRRFVGETIDITQVDVWGPAATDGSRDGTIQLDMVGAPVTCTGRMRLAPNGAGTTVTIEGTLKASVPLFGGKIEQAVLEGLTEAAKIEEKVGRAWLDGQN